MQQNGLLHVNWIWDPKVRSTLKPINQDPGKTSADNMKKERDERLSDLFFKQIPSWGNLAIFIRSRASKGTQKKFLVKITLR